jgi:transcriptional regulator with XRE-family HTH domain
VKNRLNLGSDIALAERVGVTRSLISRWRKGDTPISDERIAQICAMAKIDGTTWMAMIHAERATSTTERALWRLILDRVSAAAAVVALVCITAPGAVKAETLAAQGFAQGQNADSVYYVKCRAVLLGPAEAGAGIVLAYPWFQGQSEH